MENELYSKKYKRKLIKTIEYDDHAGYIISYGSHPCCYVVTKKYVQTSNLEGIVHGGVTFEDTKLYLDEPNDKGVCSWVEADQIIGWDYAHAGDYCQFGDNIIWGTIHTVSELEFDIKEAIKEIVKLENKGELN